MEQEADLLVLVLVALVGFLLAAAVVVLEGLLLADLLLVGLVGLLSVAPPTADLLMVALFHRSGCCLRCPSYGLLAFLLELCHEMYQVVRLS